MSAFRSLVQDVEAAIASGAGVRRAETLQQLTTLFLQQAAGLNDAHVDLFDQVISRLARQIEFRARIELAERLADVANAPPETIRELAYDADIAVAGPVLARSPRLGEPDLVGIASSQGQSHLLAIASRADLGPDVTDVLVTRGGRAVLLSVAENKTARFSEDGFDAMVRRAQDDGPLRDILAGRDDVPAETLEVLIDVARKQARAGLAKAGAASDAMIDAALAASAQDDDVGSLVLDTDIDAALPEIFAKAADGFGEDDVASSIREGRVAEALAGMAFLSSMPAHTIGQAWSAPHYDPLLFLVRGLRFSWPTFRLLLEAKSHRQPPDSLLREAFDNFQNLSPATAQRAMRFVLGSGSLGVAV